MPDVIIIGAGAAGMSCAMKSASRGKSVLLLDHSDKPGRKIIISGGGRCNFTNLYTNAEQYISENPHFCKSALKRYSPHDFLALVEKHGIPWHEKKDGQLFCDRSAKDIVNMLLEECRQQGVTLLNSCKILSITKSTEFLVKTSLGDFSSHSLVIATGGLSVPGTGASGFGYEIAEKFGLKVTDLRASLVPILWNEIDKNHFTPLAGLSLNIEVKCGDKAISESMLFTHKGLSGPAILKISNYWFEGMPLSIDLLPELPPDFLIKAKSSSPSLTVVAYLQNYFPKRLFDICKTLWLSGKDKPMGQMSTQELNKIAEHFKKWQVYPSGTEGYRTAEVTAGGVCTSELSSKTMEAIKVPGLYFIGEVVDVTGQLGGFNFQWAWASGWCCGEHC